MNKSIQDKLKDIYSNGGKDTEYSDLNKDLDF
jgi:hypothetical protein